MVGCGTTNEGGMKFPPKPTKDIYVVDSAKILDDKTKQNILTIGRELNNKYKAQIVVVTVDTVGEYPISEYAIELARKWGIGDKKLNNGMLILIAKNDNKWWRIEVGRGLEGSFPDGMAKIYAQQYLEPPVLESKDYNKGVLDLYNVISKDVHKEYAK